MPPRTRRQRAQAALQSEKIAEIPVDEPLPKSNEGTEQAIDENAPLFTHERDNDSEDETDENSFSFPLPPPPRSLTGSLRTPRHEDVLRDITDEFFHPSSPSPNKAAMISGSLKPPRRPKKPKSLAFPHDPPNWQPTSPLPPSSPLGSTSTYEPRNFASTSRAYEHNMTSFYRHAQEVEPRSGDSDPFGFFAAEKVLKERRAARPPRERKHMQSTISRPKSSSIRTKPQLTRATVTPTHPATSSVLIPTNDEDIEDLYLDEPISTSMPMPAPILRHSYIPTPSSSSASLRSEIAVPPLLEPHLDALQDQPTRSRDPLRTPRKRKRDIDAATPASSDMVSSPSPVKISVSTKRPSLSYRHLADALEAAEEHTPMPRRTTRARAKGKGKDTLDDSPKARKRARTREDVSILVSPKQACKDLEKLLPRRTTRRTAAVAVTAKVVRKARVKAAVGPVNESDSEKERKGRRKPTPRAKAKAKPTSRAKPVSKGINKLSLKSGKSEVRGLKAKPLDDVMEMSDDTRERYEQERQARLEYFRKLDGYQMQKENVYVV